MYGEEADRGWTMAEAVRNGYRSVAELLIRGDGRGQESFTGVGSLPEALEQCRQNFDEAVRWFRWQRRTG